MVLNIHQTFKSDIFCGSEKVCTEWIRSTNFYWCNSTALKSLKCETHWNLQTYYRKHWYMEYLNSIHIFTLMFSCRIVISSTVKNDNHFGLGRVSVLNVSVHVLPEITECVSKSMFGMFWDVNVLFCCSWSPMDIPHSTTKQESWKYCKGQSSLLIWTMH